VGRSVAAYGFWGDVLNPPYHAFGTVSDAPALLQQVNKQFSHTSVDVAEHNVLVSCYCRGRRGAWTGVGGGT
jgi:dynein assembly factor 3